MLQRLGLRRVPSVLLTVVLAFSLLGGTGWILSREVLSLANELPRHRENIRQRIASIRQAHHGTALEKVQTTAKEVAEQIANDAG
jgi:predicted PurR-regulated permease PerM